MEISNQISIIMRKGCKHDRIKGVLTFVAATATRGGERERDTHHIINEIKMSIPCVRQQHLPASHTTWSLSLSFDSWLSLWLCACESKCIMYIVVAHAHITPPALRSKVVCRYFLACLRWQNEGARKSHPFWLFLNYCHANQFDALEINISLF